MRLSKKQKRIAKAAPPFNRITGADFKKLRAKEFEMNYDKKMMSGMTKQRNRALDEIEGKFEKVKHSKQMLSLGNAYNQNDMIDFNKKIKNFQLVLVYYI